MPDTSSQLSAVASELDAQISKFLPKGGTMALAPEVQTILTDAGVADPEGLVSKLKDAGFYIEKKGEGEKEEDKGGTGDVNDPNYKGPSGAGGEGGKEDDLLGMPMPKARNAAAKFAFDKSK